MNLSITEPKETSPTDHDENESSDISKIDDSEAVQDDTKVTTGDEGIPPDKSSETACGPGTMLVGDVCVLDERCGPGTMLVDDACVLVQDVAPETDNPQVSDKEVVYGVIGGFVIAGAIGIVLALMYRASRRKS